MKTFTKLAFLGIFAATGIIIAGATAAQDAPAKLGDLEVTGAFTKAMLPGQPVGGGYFTIKNNGKSDDMLVSVSSPVAGNVEMHEMAMQGEVMKMRKLDTGIAIPAGKTVELTPGGLHLMFIKVKEPFKQGGKVPVTLTFEKAGKVDITLPVEAAGPAGHEHK
ncbi:copper chaperone PCu(A)C [Neorhizobium sp. BETTINA12A]|uniref:copper chaperone PCu(A)C n=1 Tax=Neorhizobium sp. BETTINA12A TaxID=2908924 RepID=UPI001FF42072|nr:copper chaperone PCu(A)C [Neorhizobium sp. BETTINA12A]MCJ9752364.1 copper chaperone PCu(A)C [Neorhizobium sp. BETTINA12A]